MNENPVVSRPAVLHRFVALLVAGLLALGLAVVVAAAPASALPCETCGGGGGGGGTITYYSTLTVNRPQFGTVSSTPPGIDCPAGSGGSCTVTDSVASADGRPDAGWPTYTLTWSGTSGYAPQWSGDCTGSSCQVTNDIGRTVSVTLYDVASPQVTGLNVPARVSPLTALWATATDNSGTVSSFVWAVCSGLLDSCTAGSFAGTNSITLNGRAPGDYTVTVMAKDAAGNLSAPQTAHTTLAAAPPLTVSTLSGVVAHPSVTFTTDDDHVAADHRWCRAYATGTPDANLPAFGACTTTSSYAPSVVDGPTTLEVKVQNDVGLLSTAARQTVVDATSPVVAFGSGPAENAVVRATSAHLGFGVTDANPGTTTCSVNNATATACTDGVELSRLVNGAYTVTVTATDLVGNVATATRHLTVAVPTAVHLSRATSSYGRAALLRATITPSTATGTVRFRTSTGATLCTATIVSGAAHCSAPATLGAGKRTVTASYSGHYSPSSASSTLVVARALTKVRAKASRTRVRRTATEVIMARGLPTRATGTVTVTRPGHRLGHATVRRGVARISFPARLKPGHYTLTVRYGGNGNYAGSVATLHITVTK